MSSTAKVSVSVPDEDLLRWAKERSEKRGVSLSAVFTEAVRLERQMEARRPTKYYSPHLRAYDGLLSDRSVDENVKDGGLHETLGRRGRRVAQPLGTLVRGGQVMASRLGAHGAR